MTEIIQINEAHGPTMAADLALAANVLRDLGSVYPGYLWDVAADHEAGILTIKLRIPNMIRKGMGDPGFLMHIATVIGADGVKKVRWAAGEVLERHKLPRSKAPDDWLEMALTNGLDRGNMVLKSRF